jgi:hypothetical protein
MVAYGLIAYRIPDVQIRLDRLGDNFYYLGFIFTLASMSAALIQLRAEPNILITTIVGVAGRVLFTQMRTEIDEVEAAIRRDIIQASNDLRAQLSLSLRDFETFHKSVQQVKPTPHSPRALRIVNANHDDGKATPARVPAADAARIKSVNANCAVPHGGEFGNGPVGDEG